MFVHLHVHTEHSSLDGLTRVRDLFDAAKADGAPAVAITDHKSLAAMWEARKHADRTGVKLIPGLEAYIAIGSRTERKTITVTSDDSASEGGDSTTKKDGKKRVYEHLTILAKNQVGWSNLVRLHNESSMHKHGRAQLIDYDLLKQHGEGLMVLTGCIGGPVFGPLSRAVAADRNLDTLFGDARAETVKRAEEFLAHPTVINESVSSRDADALRAAAARSSEAEGSDGKRYSPHTIVDWHNAMTEERERARLNVEQLIAAVGRENVFIEMMEHGNDDERFTLPELRQLAADYDLITVATNDSHHTADTDNVAHSAWLALQTDSTLANSKFSFHGTGYHVRTSQEMRELHADQWWQDACDATLTIAEKVEWDVMPSSRIRLPEFPLPEGFERSSQYFRHLISAGNSERFPAGLTDEYKDRLNVELETISSMGFIDYFLIVHDLITWARKQGFYVGPGRGSAAGSLVAYILGITQLDPIENGLLFERFLEPGRAELPDIDIDFESRHKQLIIKYLTEKWGKDHVAQIGSIGRPQIRQAFKDSMRVLDQTSSVSERLAKLLPDDVTADELYQSRSTGVITREDGQVSISEFWSAATNSVRQIDAVITLARAFFDVAKTSGVHASGVIISPEPLTDLIPMRWHKPGTADWHRWVTEWDHRDIENFGLVKFDVLAIRNLDMSHLAIDSVNARGGEQLDLYGLPHPDHNADDPRVRRAFRMLQEGRTAGVFQLESAPMTRLLEDVGPETLDDLSSVVALFRPGPLSAGMHTRFADRKNGREEVSYDYLTLDGTESRWLDTVLGVTYGVVIYQEQLMQLGRVVSGFDDVWRSKLRKAVSKKDPVVMAEVGGKFMEDASREFRDASGEIYSPVFSQQTAHNLWEAMKGSADYLFNKSHSIAYAYIAYITAYLKANYPAHYGAATLSVTPPDKAEKRLAAIYALQDEGMLVLPPSVNESGVLSAPNEAADSVLIGLGEIKGCKQNVAEAIIAARETGSYTSIPDLLKRTHTNEGAVLTHSHVEALIDSGALDAFGTRMGLRFVQRLGIHQCAAIPTMEYTPLELSVRQRSRLLVSLDQEVSDAVQKTLTGWTRPGPAGSDFKGPEAKTVSEMKALEVPDSTMMYVSGILTSYDEKPYSKGSFARVTLEDSEGSLAGVLWDSERASAKEDGTFPRVGFPFAAFGKIGTRSFTVRGGGDDDDDSGGDDHEVTRQEITVRSIYPIDVSLIQNGGVDFSPYPRIDLTNPVAPEKPKRKTKQSPQDQEVSAGADAQPERELELVAVTVSPAPVQAAVQPAAALLKQAGLQLMTDTEPVTEAAVEADAEPVTEAAVEADAEPVTEAVVEADAEPVTEAVAEAVVEVIEEIAAEPVAEQGAKKERKVSAESELQSLLAILNI